MVKRSTQRSGTEMHPDQSQSDFRLTFNAPAAFQFFDDGDTAVRLVMQQKENEERLLFRPVPSADAHADAVRTVRRKRGGLSAALEIKARRARQLLQLLVTRGATPALPFFMLHRAPDGWFTLGEHYDAPYAPPKDKPHVRVWFQVPTAPMEKEVVLDPQTEQALGEFAARVRRAKATLDQHRASRAIGRPNPEVTEARNLMRAFNDFVREVADPAMAEEDLTRPIIEAHRLLGGVIGRLQVNRSGSMSSAPIAIGYPDSSTGVAAPAGKGLAGTGLAGTGLAGTGLAGVPAEIVTTRAEPRAAPRRTELAARGSDNGPDLVVYDRGQRTLIPPQPVRKRGWDRRNRA